MGDLTQLVGGSAHTQSDPPVETTAYGRVTRSPAALTDSLTVVLTILGGDHAFTVPAGQWMPRGALLPTEGCRCLVVFDDRGDTWVPAWRPAP